MKWYRINIDFLHTATDAAALECSHYAGKNLSDAINRYCAEIANAPKCADDKTKPAKIELVQHIYSKRTGTTRQVTLAKNY